MIKILFHTRRSKLNSKQQMPVYLRVTLHGQRFETATGIYVTDAEWINAQSKNPKDSDIAKTLYSLRMKAMDIQRRLLLTNQDGSLEEFKRLWENKRERRKTLLQVFQEHNEQVEELVGKQFSPNTLKRFVTSYNHLENFIRFKYRELDWPIEKIRYQFISDYEHWLKAEQNCNHNSTMKYIAALKKIVLICFKNEWITSNPFNSFKISIEEDEKPFLTEQELATLSNKKFSIPRLDQVRDVFLFCCYTGLAYVDSLHLDASNIKTGIDGKLWVFTNREKSNVPSNVPLLSPAVNILNKYKGNAVCKHNRLLPVLANQKMNAYLKEIGDLCGIKTALTTHVARHTFATTVTLTNGVPIETVSKMLGHRSIKTTQRYARVLQQKVSEDMGKLQSKLIKE